jgi:hypothetical protein|tara:strand:- start:80 stop:292 length:213 start_codon:yes stop_codon:yes gene_type:complete
MHNKYKYLVTVGNHPAFDEIEYCTTEAKAEKVMLKLSKKYVNTQIDMASLDESTGDWEWGAGLFTTSTLG